MPGVLVGCAVGCEVGYVGVVMGRKVGVIAGKDDWVVVGYGVGSGWVCGGW